MLETGDSFLSVKVSHSQFLNLASSPGCPVFSFLWLKSVLATLSAMSASRSLMQVLFVCGHQVPMRRINWFYLGGEATVEAVLMLGN